MAVAGLRSRGPVTVNAAECVGISYPEFFDHLLTVAPGSVERSKPA
jgi:5-enolpyruvylshikimate-3-phosphate synthase